MVSVLAAAVAVADLKTDAAAGSGLSSYSSAVVATASAVVAAKIL